MVWTIRSCAMADLVYQLGRTILEGMFRENLIGLCPYGDTTTRVSGPWLVAGIEWFRPLLGGCVDSTDSRTDRWTKPSVLHDVARSFLKVK